MTDKIFETLTNYFESLENLIEKSAKLIKLSNTDPTSIVEGFRAITYWNLKIFDLIFDYILSSPKLSTKISLASEKIQSNPDALYFYMGLAQKLLTLFF